MPAPSYVLGLDLGQTHDPTALACLERSLTPARKTKYVLTGLLRFPLGTLYVSPDPMKPGIGEMIRALVQIPEKRLSGSLMAVDQTGVGRPVLDSFALLALPVTMVPVTITAGQQMSKKEDGWHVPKKDLVAVLQVLLQSERFEIVEGLKLKNVFLTELDNFRVKVTAAANETFGAWREGQHDDLILAVALAAWLAERCPDFNAASIGTGSRGETAAPPRGVSMANDFRSLPRGV